MSRKKLIRQLKNKYPKLNQPEIETFINAFSENISNALIRGNDVVIRGFGRWHCKKLKENFNARNPSTNELVYKPERVKIRFKSSQKLKKIINE